MMFSFSQKRDFEFIMDDAAKQAKKISALTLAFMAFSTVWGFGNVCNGFNYFDGTHVIFSWILMFALYFVPYALMVGELGSTFKNAEGGVSSWVNATMGPKLAYFAAGLIGQSTFLILLVKEPAVCVLSIGQFFKIQMPWIKRKPCGFSWLH